MYKLWEALDEAKKLKWVELSHSLNNDSPYWSGIPEGSVELCKVVFDWGNPMLDCRIHTFKFPGQFGTHIDFPGHFDKNGVLSEAFDVKQGVFPLCVIDITDKVAQDVHYAVTAQDIKDYEAKYGPIPDGAFVALRIWMPFPVLPRTAARTSPAGPWKRSSISMRRGTPLPTATRRLTQMLPQRRRKPRISPASAMSSKKANFRSKSCAIWIRWLPRAPYCSPHGPGSKARPACR